MKKVYLAAALGIVVSTCKTPAKPTSTVKDITPGNAKYYAAKAVNYRELEFYATDPKTGEIIKPLRKGHSFDVSGSASSMQIATFSQQLEGRKDVNYGYQSVKPWSCYDAYRFVNEPTADGQLRTNPTPPTDDFSAAEECVIELDTEDQEWFAVSITNLGDPSYRPSDYVDNTMLKNLPTSVHPVSAGPLRPGEANVTLDPAVMTTMLEFESQFQTRQSDRLARNTCLRNGRASGWLDIQGHFYCMLPYSPHRSCYSTELVTLTEPLAQVLDPKAKIGGLLAAYKASYDKCFTESADGTGRTQFTPAQAAAFKYVMWSRAGIFDFNIESQNDLINKFYATKPTPEKRPRRVTDPYPEWVPNQKIYDSVRRQQLFYLQQAAGRVVEKPLTGTWAATPLPTQTEIDTLLQNSAADPAANPYADYKADAKPANLDLPGNDILATMRKALLKFDDKTAREGCITSDKAPKDWSDLQLNFFCTVNLPAQCYKYGVVSRKGEPTARAEAYKACSAALPSSLAWAWIIDPANDPTGRVFQYVMFGQGNAFKQDQEQELLNTLWGLDNPANPDPKDCLKKRPMRNLDLAKDRKREKGQHCSLTKALPIKGIGY